MRLQIPWRATSWSACDCRFRGEQPVGLHATADSVASNQLVCMRLQIPWRATSWSACDAGLGFKQPVGLHASADWVSSNRLVCMRARIAFRATGWSPGDVGSPGELKPITIARSGNRFVMGVRAGTRRRGSRCLRELAALHRDCAKLCQRAIARAEVAPIGRGS